MRNKAGQLAVVVPWDEADDDIKAHGGKIVLCVRYAPCGLGGSGWHTEPELTESNGLALVWDDRDLLPLGRTPDLRRKKATCVA